MRIILTIIFITIISTSLKGQIVPSDCNAPDSIITKYRNYSDQLTLRKIYRNNLLFTDSIIIPKVHSDTILKALNAVFNATLLPSRDTVISMFSIYALPKIQMRSFFVRANPNLSWMEELKKGNIPCGDSLIDKLISNYNLKTRGYLFNDVIVFESDRNYNIKALEKEFKSIPGVISTEPNSYYGDGSDITDSIYSDHVQLLYTYGWGDCPSGCIYRRHWKFKAYFDCSVEFVESYGNILQKTGVTESVRNSIQIYPNPFSSFITINSDNKPYYYSIYNIYGQKIAEGNSTKNQIENVENLSIGLYFITLNVNGKTSTFKIIKE
ncbi:MAG: T9SS type A sorting domain-containing protein [Bacteroidetes bacterium]|nr:T9SS type A sorting domain-containing protein [Bacteroidota bacterium]